MTKKKMFKLLGAVGLIGFFLTIGEPKQANAMHIMEGFLPPVWCAVWFVIFIPFFILGLRNISKIVKENPEQKMLLALSGAFIFILSALKLPSVTGSTSHPTGVGIGTVFFGPSVISVLGTICLLFQSLLLAHGGLSTLGANAFSMAVVGPFVGYGVYRLARKMKINQSVSIFLCAALADLATYMMTSIQLGIVFPDAGLGMFGTVLKFMGVFCLTQIPIAIAEGLLTVVMYNLISTYIPNVQLKGGAY